jgi:3-oxoacyl-[acyl-carrier-protein] synthase-3
VGVYLPERVLTNEDFERMVDTSDEWITKRTGIKERHIASEGQATSDLAIPAARRALEDAGISADELDSIIVATCTPDHLFPATACLVQSAIGASNAMSWDLEAACSGFLFALAQGAAAVASGMCSNVLVIGTDVLTKYVDYTDRRTCILFGDAAGAAVLRAGRDGSELIFAEMGADGSRPEILNVPAGGTRRPPTADTVAEKMHFLVLEGREVFKYAVNKLAELVARVPQETGISLDQVKLVIPHQSNERIIRSVCERAGIDQEKAYMNIDRMGNTTAASIPLALREALDKGLVQRGDLVLMLAFGGGLTWGSALLRY